VRAELFIRHKRKEHHRQRTKAPVAERRVEFPRVLDDVWSSPRKADLLFGETIHKSATNFDAFETRFRRRQI
jgi:hypothetical protein